MKNYKKILFPLLLSLCLLNMQAQEVSGPKGIINRLVEIKYSTELYLTIHAKNSNTKDSALAIYNLIRWQVDGFVMQLSADMIAANSPKKLTQLNKWCLANNSLLNPLINKHRSVQFYATQFAQIDKSYQSLLFSNVSFQHKTANFKAVENINFEIKKGQTVAFVGPSGSGKTTLVKLLVGLVRDITPVLALKLAAPALAA